MNAAAHGACPHPSARERTFTRPMRWLQRPRALLGLGFVLLLLVTGASPATAGAGPAAAAPAEAAAPVFKGRAFDTCRAPSKDTMHRWLSSPYRGVGVYFGGRGRACKEQKQLSRGWVRSVTAQGWRVLPLYVGSQSPCVRAAHKRQVRMGGHPWKQGRAEGRDAVRAAGRLAIGAGSALYLDMEAYDHRNKKCARSTLLFVRGWNREVRERGYVPGFYSSADHGVRHMEAARRAGTADLPAAIWYARWRVRASVTREPALSDGAWTGRRVHQYAGNVREKHGGRTLLIDRNLVHAPVANVH